MRLHVQCPFRVVYRDRVLSGSYDMRYPRRADAFSQRETMFDRIFRRLNARVVGLVVESTAFGRGGAFTMSAQPSNG